MSLWGKFVFLCSAYNIAQGIWLADHLAIRGNPLVDPPCVRRPALDIPNQLVMAALREGIPPHRLLALAWNESKYFNAKRQEYNGSMSCGIMQLNNVSHKFACSMSVSENIATGAKHLGRLISKYGPQAEHVYRFGRP